MNRIYDADASSREATVDGLRVLEIGTHPCRWIKEPGAKVLSGMLRVPLVLRDQPGRGQRRHLQAESNQGVSMCNEVVGIGHPVVLDIRPALMIRIGPPVIALGKIVVLASSTTRGRICSDSDGTLADIPARSTQHSAAVNLDDIESVALRRGGNLAPREREGSPRQATHHGCTELPACTSHGRPPQLKTLDSS